MKKKKLTHSDRRERNLSLMYWTGTAFNVDFVGIIRIMGVSDVRLSYDMDMKASGGRALRRRGRVEKQVVPKGEEICSFIRRSARLLLLMASPHPALRSNVVYNHLHRYLPVCLVSNRRLSRATE